jgi:hypothetical protein
MVSFLATFTKNTFLHFGQSLEIHELKIFFTPKMTKISAVNDMEVGASEF